MGKKGLEINLLRVILCRVLIKNGFIRHHADQVEHVLGLGERLRLLNLDISGDRLQGIDRFGHLKVLLTVSRALWVFLQGIVSERGCLPCWLPPRKRTERATLPREGPPRVG